MADFKRRVPAAGGSRQRLNLAGCLPQLRKEGVMKKTRKSRVGHPKKLERMSQQIARSRLRVALAAAAESKKPEGRAQRLRA